MASPEAGDGRQYAMTLISSAQQAGPPYVMVSSRPRPM